MYQVFNIPQFKQFLEPYIQQLSKLPDDKFNNTVKQLKRIITSDDEYMKRGTYTTLRNEYDKQLISQDTMRTFKPTNELKTTLDYVIPKIVEDYIDLTRFNNLDYIEHFYKRLELHNAKELEQVAGYYITRFDKIESMNKLLKQFTNKLATEDNTLILFKKNNEAILVLIDTKNKSVENIFNYRNKENAIELLNTILSNIVENVEIITYPVLDKVDGIMANNKIYLIENFENLSKLEINGDYMINTTKLYKTPEVFIVKGNLVIKKCNPYFSMQERCTVTGNLIIHKEMNKLSRILNIGGYADFRHSTIKEMPINMIVKDTCLLHNSDIKVLPKKFGVGGGLSLNSMRIDEMPKELYVEQDLDLYKANINEMPEVLYVGNNCDIRDSNITYIGRKTRINGILYKNSKVTISNHAEIYNVNE